MARCALIESSIPHNLWPYAVSYAAYTLKRLPTRAIDWKTPFELWKGRKPAVQTMRPFGCRAFIHLDIGKRTSLEKTSIQGTFLGYPPGQKAFFIRRSDNGKVISCRNCIFDEEGQANTLNETKNDPMGMADTRLGVGRESQTLQQEYLESQEETLHEMRIHSAKMSPPKNYEEAMQRPDAKQWRKAAEQEMKAHHDNRTLTLVEKPANAKVIKGRWVFTYKQDQEKKVTHKARYVAKGFSQTAGVDYDETFAAVLTLTAMRWLIAIAVTKGWKLLQKDFKTAYLNAILTIPIYMEQPIGFFTRGGGKAKLVCLLNKALYGLKQAGRAWQHALFNLLKEEGFTQSLKDSCVWFKHIDATIVIIAVYVDDILMTGNNPHELNRITTKMGQKFRMKDLGQMKQFLGIEATHHTEGDITISQVAYTKEIIRKFKQQGCRPISTPVDSIYVRREGRDRHNRSLPYSTGYRSTQLPHQRDST
jgi:hypothetical protein